MTEKLLRVQFIRDGVEQYHVLRVRESAQAPGNPTRYYAISDNGLGCGKDYGTPKEAAEYLVRAAFPCRIVFVCET